MDRFEAKQIIEKILWSFHGTFYIWGGDDPSGFDCSGLAIEVLKSVNLLPRNYDNTAHGLYELYKEHPCPPQLGALAFFGSTSKIVHVEVCLNDEVTMGASGGGSRTRTIEVAQYQNAFIKVRGLYTRSDFVGTFDPLETKN